MIQRELTFEDYLGMLRRHWILIAVLAIVGAGGAYGVSRFLPNHFTSQSQVLIEAPIVSEKAAESFANSNINQDLTIIKQEVLNRERLEPLIQKYDLYSSDAGKVPVSTLVGRLQSDIAVSAMRPPDDNSPIPGFIVEVTGEQPQAAQAVCTTITSAFIDANTRRRVAKADTTTQFLSTQIADAKAKLDEQDAKLAAFQATHPGTLPDQEQTNLSIMSSLTSELSAASQDINRAQQDKSLAESMLQQQRAARQAAQTGKNPQTLEEQLAALQTQLANLQSRYTDNYPDVVKTKGEIAELERKIADADNLSAAQDPKSGSIEPLQFIQLEAQIKADTEAIAAKTKDQQRIQTQIAEAQARIRETPAAQEEYKLLNRDHESALDFYNSLLTKQNQAVMGKSLDQSGESETFTVVQPASLPVEPSSPNRPLFAGGGLAGGLVLGLGLAFFMEMRDSSLRTERDVEMQLRLPVIAVIPTIDLTATNKTAPRRPLNPSAGFPLGAGD
jgi:polysaccharide chain length determinant protein (PEP-CTERM system associated)